MKGTISTEPYRMLNGRPIFQVNFKGTMELDEAKTLLKELEKGNEISTGEAIIELEIVQRPMPEDFNQTNNKEDKIKDLFANLDLEDQRKLVNEIDDYIRTEEQKHI